MSPSLLAALIAVESGGNDMAVGDAGRAIGCLQIHRCVVTDVNARYGTHYRWQGMTNRADACRVATLYLQMYGRGATTEQLARRWNGGPTGDRKAATAAYWVKVKKHLE